MIQEIEKIQELKLDKSSWKLTKLGDLAEDVSKRVDNPSTSIYDRFVGLEHFVSGDIKIKNWGSTENLASSAKAFQAGDILFARRNAYLRRASLVEFDGCCSGDAFVIRENHNKVIPGFLAFLMNSDALWDYANSNAAGTMSKRVKWRDLAEYEFLLPPKEEQTKLAELLWAMDEVIERELDLEIKLKIARDTFFEKLINETDGSKVPLSKVLIQKNGKSQVPHNRERYIGLEHIESGEYTTQNFESSEGVKAQCNIVDKGDLCYSKLRPYLDKAIIASFDAVSTTELLVYNTKMVSKEYVLYYLHSRPFLNYITGQGFGTKMPRVSHSIISSFEILVPAKEEVFFAKMDEFVKILNSIKLKISSSKSLQKSLINQVF